ncbi:MAG TPA: acetate--CoA ligase [Candidatus Bathyarchaeia archaeon]|nr:acetate--CoA ligase [Candidatus Bathyarchaeia archaeon]
MSVNWALPFDEKIVPENKRTLIPIEAYQKIHKSTVTNYREFWAGVASELNWFKRWDRILDDSNPPFYKWFPGGQLNASYLCLDRHIHTWRKNKVAIIWEGEPTENGAPTQIRKLTYQDVYRHVNRIAYVLREKYGIRKGDTIGFYLPMIPEFPIFMLAAARLGACFTVIFSGFSADSLADRLVDADAKLLVTADVGRRRGNLVKLKEVADRASEKATCVRKIIVVRHTGNEVPMDKDRDAFLDDILRETPETVYVEPEPVKSEDPLYILHTSGTTGRPKGQVHDTGGYLTLLHATMRWVFDARDDDVYWCTADIGWVTGHSYIVFGPLMEVMTGLMYEGALEYPAPDRWVSILERHGVNILYTSPTAIRSFMKNGEEWVGKHNTSSVRLMHSVGEPINPEAFRWMHRHVGRDKIPFGSTWWMTETGGILVSHTPGLYMVPMKPGTNGLAILGIDADVVDDDGKGQKSLERGYLVIRNPWPGMPLTIHNDPDRYREVYWIKFPGSFYPGDYAVRDDDGYFWILGRADEVIKVAGHRLGTYELESALIQHHAVAEAAAVAVPDELKGEVPVAFVILRAGQAPSEQLNRELNDWVREKVGPIASLKQIFFVSKLPKTRSAKIMRRVVQAVVAGKPIGDVTTLEDEASVDEVNRAFLDLKQEIESRTASRE